MIESINKRLVIGGHALPKGDVDILKQLLRMNRASAFELMQATGKLYVQYIQYRIRVLKMLGVIMKTGDVGIYEIAPEIKEELLRALDELEGIE